MPIEKLLSKAKNMNFARSAILTGAIMASACGNRSFSFDSYDFTVSSDLSKITFTETKDEDWLPDETRTYEFKGEPVNEMAAWDPEKMKLESYCINPRNWVPLDESQCYYVDGGVADKVAISKAQYVGRETLRRLTPKIIEYLER